MPAGDQARCVIARHDPDRIPLAADGIFVCPGHASKIRAIAGRMPDLYADLGAVLVGGGGGMTERVRGPENHGLNLNDAAAELRGQIRHDLAWWALLVADERGVSLPGAWVMAGPPPGAEGPGWPVWEPDESVAALAGFLVLHTDWLLGRPFVDEYHDALDGLAGEAGRVAYPSGRRSFDLPRPEAPRSSSAKAACPREFYCDVATGVVVRCGGALRASVSPGDDFELGSVIRCRSCGTEYAPSEWLTLGRHIREVAA